MNDIFFNEFGRLRSGWRFGIFITAFYLCFSFFSTLLIISLATLAIDFELNSPYLMILISSLGLFFAVFLGWLFGKIFENLPFRSLGAWFTKFWLKDFVLGFLIGAVTIALAVLIAILFGNLSFEINSNAGSSAVLHTLIISLIVFTIGAAFEEALVRGYMFQTLVRANLAWLAIFLTSAVFAYGHLNNPNSAYFSSINTFIAGVWLGIAYLKTRTLWLVFGLHLAWNWFQGAIFGIEVSGLTSMLSAPLLKESDPGPVWITGGEYGLEGGIACTIALVFSTILIWFLPILKPTGEMLELTDKENPTTEKNLDKA